MRQVGKWAAWAAFVGLYAAWRAGYARGFYAGKRARADGQLAQLARAMAGR